MKYLLLLVFLIGCSQENGPISLLEQFVNYRFSDTQTKDKLLEMTSGKLYESIESMTEEEFAQFSKMPIKKKKFKVMNQKCSEISCSITYLVRYETYENDEKSFVTEVKKIAQLIKSEEGWKIDDVTNIKGFHDSVKPINVIGN